MESSCFVAVFLIRGTGQLHRSEEPINTLYCKIWSENILSSARKLKLGGRWVFWHGNDPKHIATARKLIKVLDRPFPCPCLNRKYVEAEAFLIDSQETWHIYFCKDEWDKIPPDLCANITVLTRVSQPYTNFFSEDQVLISVNAMNIL